jgi:hypothetical protein
MENSLKDIKDLTAILRDLAIAIADLKETECGNSGTNWYDSIEETYFNPPNLEL